MDSLFDTLGQIEFVVARGWMSPYEAASMKAGDIVISAGTAGTEGELAFNGDFLASAWLVVSGAKGAPAFLAARVLRGRVRGFSRPAPWSPGPEPGPALTDLLPFSLIAAEMECSLGALEGAGSGSLLRFDTPFDAPGTMELRILGIPAARGPLVVRGEWYGIKVEEVLHAPFNVSEPRYTGALISFRATADGPDPAAGFKVYDIRRPDAVTRLTIAAISRIHARFLETLRVRYPEFEGYELTAVDQMTAVEWMADVPRGQRRTILAGAGRRHRDYGADRTEDAELRIIEGPAHPAPLDPQSRAEIQASLSALRDREQHGPVAVHLPPASGICAADFFACLRGSWNLVADLAFRDPRDASAFPPDPHGESGLVPNEMVITVRFEKQGAPALDMAYTLRSLAAQIPALESHGRAAF